VSGAYNANVTVRFKLPSSAVTFANGKTLGVSNSLTLAGTDGSTLDVGAGGTLGSAALKNTGTSGSNVPLLNGVNTWSGLQNLSAGLKVSAQTLWPLDATSVTQTLTNGSTFVLPAGGGLLVVSNNADGQAGVFNLGGGNVTLISQTGSLFANSVTAGKISVQYSSGASYSIYNNTGSTVTIYWGGISIRAGG
jgi:hypothetical protein